MRLFHKITDSQWDAMKTAGITWQTIIEEYSAPKWCQLGPEAIGLYGCWSLCLKRVVKCKSDCEDCPYVEVVK